MGVAFWDERASEAGVFNVGDNYHRYTQRQASFIVAKLDMMAGVVLDLGCGIGRLMHEVTLSRPRLELLGVDSSLQMVLTARRATHGTVFRCDGMGFPELPRLDGAYCVLMFQHVNDDTVATYLTDLARLLRPGARLVSQWTTEGEEAPMAYPRSLELIEAMHADAGLSVFVSCDDDGVTGYADGWLWTVAANQV